MARHVLSPSRYDPCGGQRLLALAAAFMIPLGNSGLVQAQPFPSLSSELIHCRESRILVRQAQNLVPTLTNLGLSEDVATGFLADLQSVVDQCEVTPNHVIPDLPEFPEPPLHLDPSLLLGARLAEASAGLSMSVRSLSAQELAATHFLLALDEYETALMAQCGSGPSLAWIAPTQAIFEEHLDDAAFGLCGAGGNQGTGRGDLPEPTSFASEEKQCQAAVFDAIRVLAVDDCPTNPRGTPRDDTTIVPGTETNEATVTHDPDEDGNVVEERPRQGKTKEGHDVTEETTNVYDRDGNLLSSQTKGKVTIPGRGVVDYTTTDPGLGTAAPGSPDQQGSHFQTLTNTDGEMVYETFCTSGGCKTEFGPGSTLFDQMDDAADPIIRETSAAYSTWRHENPVKASILESVVAGFIAAWLLNPVPRCARIPGSRTPPLYYKDDLGSPIDVLDMIHQCSCEAKRARCPMCSDFGFAPATSCETASEEARRECLMNPYGPRDEVRPECIQYLMEDNPDFDFEAHLCSAVQCLDGTRQRVSLRSDGSLACGCFAGDQGGAMQPDPTGFCQIARCETGSCQCHGVAGVLACGCVSPPPPLDAPPAPPVGLSLPRLPDPLRLPISSAPSALLPR